MRFFRTTIALAVAATLCACVSVTDVNDSFRRIDRLWALEYQRDADEYRYRIVGASPIKTFEAARKTFLALGMPLTQTDLRSGVLVAENNAPAPLTTEEWKLVLQKEAPRVKEVGGWYMVLPENPQDYTVAVRAKLTEIRGATMVVLDYEMDSPKYRAMGFQPAKSAPPQAVQLATLKFWRQLEAELAKEEIAPPRRRTPSETAI